MRSALTVVGLAVCLAAGIALTSCKSNEPDPKDRVSTALKDAHLQDVDVDYDRGAHVVHLKGNVKSVGERARAEEIADRAVGTSGKVLNEVTVKGIDEKTADDRDGKIQSELKDMVDKDPQLKNRDVTFEVNDGAVEAKGWVVSAAEKERVSDMVRSVGAREFANGLDIRPDKARRDRTINNRTAAEGEVPGGPK